LYWLCQSLICMGIRKFSFFPCLLACKGTVSISKLLLENACQIWQSLHEELGKCPNFFLIWGVQVQNQCPKF
jgi:hypothetical protein